MVGLKGNLAVESGGFSQAPSSFLFKTRGLNMINSTVERLQRFMARDEKPQWWNRFGTVLLLAITLLVWMQTESYIRAVRALGGGPTYPELKAHIEESKAIQAGLALTKKEEATSTSGFTYVFVGDLDQRKLEKAKQTVLNDASLRQMLNDGFGTSLHEVKAVITLSWEADSIGYTDSIGITSEGGWSDLQEAKSSCAIGATTIRDRPGVKQRTIDGTPRIILNPNALAYPEWTEFVIFHEMFHAMNLPAYSPRFAWLQTDLVYLKEYRSYVERYNLGTSNNIILWCFTVLLAVFTVVLFVRYRRNQSRSFSFES